MPDAQPRYKRILLKVSGEAGVGGDKFGIDPKTVQAVAEEVAQVVRGGVEVCLVVGDFINAELPGRLADPTLPWAMLWPGVEGLRHPSPLYQALVDGLLVFIILWLYARKPRPRLAVGAMYTLLYGCARFFTEYFRMPDWQVTVAGLPITSGQMLSLPMIVAGLVMLAWAYSHGQKRALTA